MSALDEAKGDEDTQSVIYLDNNATTPLAPEVKTAITEAMVLCE